MVRQILTGMVMVFALGAQLRAEEGMWLPNKLPTAALKADYGFEPTESWELHIQRSCVRVGAGGSASFVSGDGLLMTNHHVAADVIANLSDAEHNYMRDGFIARTREEELKAPDAELTVLMKIEDITERVNAKVMEKMTPAQALAARKEAMAEIEKEAAERSGLQPEIVELYQGARYDLYLYKRYTDVRLVMAPEAGIAFFGGDIENFEYPRYNLDITFLRAYEDGKPAKTPDHLKWSMKGPKENELVFIVGHPGRTQRMFTVDHLRFLRDVHVPLILGCYNQHEVALQQFAARSAEHERIAGDMIQGIQNGRKAYCGILAGLLDEQLMQVKRKNEDALRSFIKGDATRQKAYGPAYEELSAALERVRADYKTYWLLNNRRASLCRLYDIAKKLVLASEERPKADGERFEEYRDANLPSLEVDLFSTAPIYPEFEQFVLRESLIRLGRNLGGESEAVKIALAGQDAGARAATLVSGTGLADVKVRKALYEGGKEAIAKSEDPMIRLARELAPPARAARKKYEDEYESVEKEAYSKIAKASFEMQGDKVYPDATFTLRFAFGSVKGYDEPERNVPAMTTFSGLYKLAAQKGDRKPYDLPPRWVERKDKIDLTLPFNFVCTNDIIGGNSGSPIINREGELVGIVFDGNIHGLIWDFQFDMKRARAVGVHSRAIIEALEKVYDAEGLVKEILGK